MRGEKKDEGAGDQGIMFGYACDETPDLMPAPLYYSHKILKLLADARHTGKEKALGPDAKSQVTRQLQERQAGGRHADRRLAPAYRREPDLRGRAQDR